MLEATRKNYRRIEKELKALKFDSSSSGDKRRGRKESTLNKAVRMAQKGKLEEEQKRN